MPWRVLWFSLEVVFKYFSKSVFSILAAPYLHAEVKPTTPPTMPKIPFSVMRKEA